MRSLYTLIALFTLTVSQAQESTTVRPQCKEGFEAFYTYISSNMVIPEFEKDAVLRISVSFVVEKDGTVSTVQATQDPGYGLGEEAVRVVKGCPFEWTPGILDGRAVRAQFVLPIVIQVSGEPKVPQGEGEPAVEDAEGQR